MGGMSGPYLIATLIGAAIIGIFWARPERYAAVVKQPRQVFVLLALVAAGIGLCLWSISLERSAYTFERQSPPVAIAIAFDLSPSMLAIPHPDFGDAYPPRFERGKAALLDLIRGLEEQGIPVIVSIVGFTKEANIIMGWDQSAVQVRDILEYAVSPDLFGSSGTSIEAAAKSLREVFATLPDTLRANSRRLAIIVSDGEDTMRASSFDYAKEELAAGDFDTIALQTGLIDRNEGVPTFGRIGEFTGFRIMRGETYTVPDVAAMDTIADASAGRGLHIRAEIPGAADRMRDFIVGRTATGATPDAALLSTIGMFAIVSFLCAIVLR